MRTVTGIVLLLLALFCSCMFEHAADLAVGTPPVQQSAVLHASSDGEGWDPFAFDLVQRTCALYVAVRSAAFESPLEFGREVEDTMVHWNMCPGGNMVACVAAPTADGDTIMTGIPWPY